MSVENHRASNMVLLGSVVFCTGMAVKAYFREKDENKTLAATADIVQEKVQKELSLEKSPQTKCTFYVETDRNKVQCDSVLNACHSRVQCAMDCVKSDAGFDRCCGKVEQISPKTACEAEKKSRK